MLKNHRLYQNRKKTITFIVLMLFTIYIIPTVVILFANEKEKNMDQQVSSKNQEVENSAAEKPQEPVYSVTVLKDEKKVKMDLESYVIGVVAAEMPASFHEEALKAQAIAARTYIVNHALKEDPQMKRGYVTDTVFDQVYKTEAELKEIWKDNYQTYLKKITDAVKETEDKIIVYENEPIFPAFFSTSNGFTENAEDYWLNPLPYLVSVESPWDQASPRFNQEVRIDQKEVVKKLKLTSDALLSVKTVYNDSGRLKSITFGQVSYTGRELREALQLPSSDIVVEVSGDDVVFKTQGYGHGVGMSQYGAEGMAKEGYSYEDILKYYYKGTSISLLSSLIHSD